MTYKEMRAFERGEPTVLDWKAGDACLIFTWPRLPPINGFNRIVGHIREERGQLVARSDHPFEAKSAVPSPMVIRRA